MADRRQIDSLMTLLGLKNKIIHYKRDNLRVYYRSMGCGGSMLQNPDCPEISIHPSEEVPNNGIIGKTINFFEEAGLQALDNLSWKTDEDQSRIETDRLEVEELNDVKLFHGNELSKDVNDKTESEKESKDVDRKFIRDENENLNENGSLGTIREDDNEGKEAPENKENEENINNNSMEKDLTNENKSLKDMIEDEDANEKNVNNSQ